MAESAAGGAEATAGSRMPPNKASSAPYNGIRAASAAAAARTSPARVCSKPAAVAGTRSPAHETNIT